MESIGENKLLKLTCAKNAQVRMEGRWATSSILELVRISNLHFFANCLRAIQCVRNPY